MSLPSRNALLTAVHAKGFSKDGSRPATAGTAKWSGQEYVLIVETVEEQTSTETKDELVRTHLTVPAYLGVAWKPEDTVTYTSLIDHQEHERRVRDVDTEAFAGMVRLTLFDQ